MAEKTPDPAILPVAEERLVTAKRRVVTGQVRVRLLTETEDAPVTADLSGERVEVTHVPVNREVAEPPATRTEGDVTIIPVLEEVLSVERRLFLREEIHLRRVPTTETVETTVPLRRQRAVVERDPPPDIASTEENDQ